jgi:hypothetical protein
MAREKPDDIDEPDDDWIGLDSVSAYRAAWRRLHDGRLVIHNTLQEDDREATRID